MPKSKPWPNPEYWPLKYRDALCSDCIHFSQSPDSNGEHAIGVCLKGLDEKERPEVWWTTADEPWCGVESAFEMNLAAFKEYLEAKRSHDV